MINSGAIVISSLLKNNLSLADRFDWVSITDRQTDSQTDRQTNGQKAYRLNNYKQIHHIVLSVSGTETVSPPGGRYIYWLQ